MFTSISSNGHYHHHIYPIQLYNYTTIPLYNYIKILQYNYMTSPRCSGSSNNLNLQRSRYSILKLDIDKPKYEKWSNTDLNNQNV